jgi:hypothetical protein
MVVARAARPTVDLALWTRHVAYADRRETRDLDVLVERYSSFATAMARRHYRRGEPIDDLVQVSHEARQVLPTRAHATAPRPPAGGRLPRLMSVSAGARLPGDAFVPAGSRGPCAGALTETISAAG